MYKNHDFKMLHCKCYHKQSGDFWYKENGKCIDVDKRKAHRHCRRIIKLEDSKIDFVVMGKENNENN